MPPEILFIKLAVSISSLPIVGAHSSSIRVKIISPPPVRISSSLLKSPVTIFPEVLTDATSGKTEKALLTAKVPVVVVFNKSATTLIFMKSSLSILYEAAEGSVMLTVVSLSRLMFDKE